LSEKGGERWERDYEIANRENVTYVTGTRKVMASGRKGMRETQ